MTSYEKELFEYLKFFYGAADFGPADSDVRMGINEAYEEKYSRKVPKGYEIE